MSLPTEFNVEQQQMLNKILDEEISHLQSEYSLY